MREVHEERSSREDGYEQFQVDETLRAASDGTIAVEFGTTWTNADGTRHDGHGSEFWMMCDGRLRECRAYIRPTSKVAKTNISARIIRPSHDEWISPRPFTRIRMGIGHQPYRALMNVLWGVIELFTNGCFHPWFR